MLSDDLAHYLGVADVPIIFEEIDKPDFDAGVRVFPTLSRWKNVYDRLGLFYSYSNTRYEGEVFHLRHTAAKVMLGDTLPHVMTYAKVIGIVSGSDRLSLSVVPELAKNGYYAMFQRIAINASVVHDTLMHEYWSPNEAKGSGHRNLSERDLIIANRLYVMASSVDCAERLATMALMSI